MNDLNSVIIEGTIISDIKESEEYHSFQLKCNGIDESVKKIIKYDPLKFTKGKLLKVGTLVRVVGRTGNRNTIYAEHIEFRVLRRG